GVARREQVAQIEVGVADRRGQVVHADVHQFGAGSEQLRRQPGLLDSRAARTLPGRLAGVDVAARLQPEAELHVAHQDRAAATDDEHPAGDVNTAAVDRERVV